MIIIKPITGPLKNYTNPYIKGSTLIESVVAMVLLAFFALLIYSQLILIDSGSNPNKEIEAFRLVNNAVADVKCGMPLDSIAVYDKGMIVNIEIEPIPCFNNLDFLKIEALDKNNSLLYSHIEVVYKYE